MKLDFCVACGEREADRLEHHHFVPRSAGGSDEESNLITLCHVCHGKAHGYERSHIRKLTKEALARKKAAGGVLGNKASLVEARKLGAAVQANEADEFAGNVLPIIRQVQADGATSLRAIAEALNSRNVKTARGAAWSAVTVSRIIDRAA